MAAPADMDVDFQFQEDRAGLDILDNQLAGESLSPGRKRVGLVIGVRYLEDSSSCLKPYSDIELGPDGEGCLHFVKPLPLT